MKSRAELKRELDATVPLGEEQAYLESATAALETARENLKALQEERVRLMRQISVRERKQQDWKGKIPRDHGAPMMAEATAELARAGSAQCHRVADIIFSENDAVQKVEFRPEFRRALSGLDGFAKAWVIALGPAGVQLDLGSCSGERGGVNDRRLYLWLVNVITASPATGIVQVSGLEFLQGRTDLAGFDVLDVKPYLPYCEAWPESAG